MFVSATSPIVLCMYKFVFFLNKVVHDLKIFFIYHHNAFLLVRVINKACLCFRLDYANGK